MTPRGRLHGALRTGVNVVRRGAARFYKMDDVEAAFLSAPDAARFGQDLAELLARRPKDALDIANDRVAAYQYFAHLGNIVRQFEIDLVIDAGAHSGQYASSLYGYGGYAGEMHSFEPVPTFYEAMAKHVPSIPGWQAFNLALGDVAGPSRIFLGAGHGGTSSLLPQTSNLAYFAPDAVLGEGIDITVARIDERYADVLQGGTRRVMLKLDVQGFEERVLASAGDLLSRFKLVQVEVSGIPLYEGQASLGGIVKLLEDAGFALIYTCNGFGRNRSIFIDFDFVFCRRDDLEALKL
jgi:FkbM family methyltransferase